MKGHEALGAPAPDDRRRRRDHRRRRRDRALGEVRRSGWRRPHHHLQLRALPDGRSRLAGGLHAVRRRQRHRHGDGRRGAAGRQGHARPGRRLRHRPVPADARLPGARSSRSASPASRTSRRSACATAKFRQNLEETGMGFGLEVDMIAAAHEAGPPDHALRLRSRARRGRWPRPAPTSSSPTWASRRRARSARRPPSPSRDRPSSSRPSRDAAVAVKPDVIALCHGGPIAEPADAQYILDHTTGVAGFFGASSMERLPTEIAITENMKRFKGITRAAAAAY